jgi:hypothetical protein
MYKVLRKFPAVHDLRSMACSTRGRSLSQSSQHTANIARSELIVPGRGSPSLSLSPLDARAFEAGNTTNQRMMPSNLNPNLCAALTLLVFCGVAFHCTQRSPRLCGGKSKACKMGRVIRITISVLDTIECATYLIAPTRRFSGYIC